MIHVETTKGNTLRKLVFLISFVFALILQTGPNEPTARSDSSKISSLHSTINAHKDTAHTAWCVLDKNNIGKYFYHFPHTLQVMSQCWSFFMSEKRHYDIKHCGLLFNVTDGRKNFKFRKISPWARDLIDAMNCTKIIRSSNSGPEPPMTDDFFHMKPTNRWFEEAGDVGPLQEAVLRRRTEGFATREELSEGTLSIGLIQRFPSKKKCERRRMPKDCAHYREFINLEKIQKALADNFPQAKVRNTRLKGMDLTEQASWWWHRDIVIAAHGASMSNAMFMRQGTAAIEVFPTDYEPMMFQDLMDDIGVHHYAILNSTPPGVTGYKNRDVPLAPNVDEIVRFVREAIERRRDSAVQT